MVSGGPGDSANSFAGGAEFIAGYDSTITVYLIDQRGTDQSSIVDCANPPSVPFDPYDAVIVKQYDDCNKDVATKYATTFQYYSTYYACVDFKTIIDTLNPAKVAIYALSYGTFFMNTYLMLPGARADVVVLDGPVPPDRWPLEDNGRWTSKVKLFCAQCYCSSACSG